MKAGASSGGNSGLWRLLLAMLSVCFVDLGVILLLVFLHAYFSAAILELPVQILAALLGVVSVATIAVGVAFAWRAHPSHRRVVAFVVAITLATLLAHLYTIGQPSAYESGSLNGTTSTVFSNSDIVVTPTLSSNNLTLRVTVAGTQGIANLSVALGTTQLPESGFHQPPTLASPLEPACSASDCGFFRPAQSITGSWPASSVLPNSSLTVSYLHLTCYSGSSQGYGCIMDEVFYVPEAMGILAGQQCSTTASNCHMEHPYLVQGLIAAGMAVFGEYNAVSWRIFPVLLGTFSIPLLFGVAWKVSGNKRIAYLSATLLALDVMYFSQSSGGLLDIPPVFFGLAAMFAYFWGVKVWKFDRLVIAGVLFGVAGLAKETAVFFALAFLTYVLVFGEGNRWSRVYSVFKVAIVVALVFAAGLQAYDSTLASAAMPTFVQHVGYIFSYGSSLKANVLACQPTTGYWCKFPNDKGGPPILPTDWVLYYSPVAYFATTVCPDSVNGVCKAPQFVGIAYYGVTNLIETWTVFVWLPLVAYAVFRLYRKRQPSLDEFSPEEGQGAPASMSGDTRLGALALIWFLWTYLPYLGLFAAARVTYPFYFVPAIPAVALGAAWWLTRDWFPRRLVWIYVAFAFLFFFVYFPDKAFLPDWLRVLIGH